ncbi:MAG: 6-O-methylguanine DNA methyltransferase [Candidatus Kerfeldbacteria bacterium CG15_BIG_FIL_POST_REV_8_21_14_020_45_12]|uniref:6-O-methylguanine DNA methyltransferase n=1 Tax=Candidatus Kerfeldbacteria bacterium CG15_BIG_FIL_POST_REV_8_21_14_020_45_12 TaxID=2014247 RepID=A0A2M7H522_9BACT|nr:MAG: 6-O-methylguanine DNA methyltransferase [Candidatus Kerfeldbacteria bacterium CG15_BIG_FIL_POST_REV_8_21_14_020_45_12]PJA93136.1 MAG: 6-O-methylguanine DNA methyltransferase [Candidatus Kerfeldbacteria bacterium CG_4_9_14_3_um_filter_45_8]
MLKTPSKTNSLPFTQKVLAIVKKIPRGKVMTYGEVAKMAGSPKAARAVGNIMSHNWNKSIPCHRVVKADGTTGGYNRGSAKKIKLLKSEGVNI